MVRRISQINFICIDTSPSPPERYLATQAQLDHCCELLLASDHFVFHSGRTCDQLLDDARTVTDPHVLLILYNIFMRYGQRHSSFFRSPKKWQPLLPLLMDHILIDLDDASSQYIEGKLRLLAVEMLYEVCRVQKISEADLCESRPGLSIPPLSSFTSSQAYSTTDSFFICSSWLNLHGPTKP